LGNKLYLCSIYFDEPLQDENFMNEIERKYKNDGYVIFERIIPTEKINNILDALEEFKRKGLPFYSQSIHTWIKPPLDSNGFMSESMENFTRVMWLNKLSKYGNDILLSQEINECLKIINPSARKFVLWQNMLFDKSTGTIDHYDSYYLDTLPSGNLIGAWIALEDIDERCGPFKIYPGSHLEFLDTPYNKLNHENFRLMCANYAKKTEFKHALLKKGDVLFWHPSLIHGASIPLDEKYSRKSLTSHYYPYGYSKKGDDEDYSISKSLYRKIINKPKKRSNYQIMITGNAITDLRFSLGGLKIYLTSKIKGAITKKMDMKRTSYN